MQQCDRVNCCEHIRQASRVVHTLIFGESCGLASRGSCSDFRCPVCKLVTLYHTTEYHPDNVLPPVTAPDPLHTATLELVTFLRKVISADLADIRADEVTAAGIRDRLNAVEAALKR